MTNKPTTPAMDALFIGCLTSIPGLMRKIQMQIKPKNRCKPSERSKTSTISVEEAKSGNRKRNSINFAKPAYHRTAKSLVRSCTVRQSHAILLR